MPGAATMGILPLAAPPAPDQLAVAFAAAKANTKVAAELRRSRAGQQYSWRGAV